MKKIFVKTIFAAVTIVLAAMLLVTCDILFQPDGDGEWTDVEYSPGGELLTVYFKPDGLSEDAKPGPDTWGVPRTAAQRALTLELAKMGHDFFEAVFVSGTTIARASWEIGTPAGIAGVPRPFDYGKVVGDPAAVIFVGKKTVKTLLGIGQIVRVDSAWVANTNVATVGSTTKSVTFGVWPITTHVGFSTIDTVYTEETFLTDFGLGTVNAANTKGQKMALQASAEYPLFKLPEVSPTHDWGYPEPPAEQVPATPPTILAKYKIGGVDDPSDNPGFPSVSGVGLVTAVKQNLLAAAMRADKLEIIKRTPSFFYKGQIFDAVGDVIDQYTKVDPTNNNGAVASPAAATTAIVNPIEMKFTQDPRYTGIFAITFQVPVFAITAAPLDATNEPANSTNGGPPATKWYIRPGYNQYQYLLDDGEAAGGAVMLGAGVSGLDWLDIFTVGIGFSN